MKHALRRLSLAVSMLLAGCASMDRTKLGWVCTGQASAGDANASADIFLNADGTRRSFWYKWEWTFRQDDVELSEQQWQSEFHPEIGERLLVFVNLPKRIVRRVVSVGVGGGEGRAFPSVVHGSNPVPHQSQYAIDFPFAALEESVRAGGVPEVIGFDRQGAMLFRLALQLEPALRGRDAMRRAVSQAEEMTRSYATACQRERASQDSIIIT